MAKKKKGMDDDSKYALRNWVDYYDKLSPEDKKFIKKFHAEFHGTKKASSKHEILTKKEDKKRAVRARNNRNRDILDAATRLDKVVSFEPWHTPQDEEKDWLEVYKYEGKEAAEQFINELFDRDLENSLIDPELTEARRTVTLKKLKIIDQRRGMYKCKKNRK